MTDPTAAPVPGNEWRLLPAHLQLVTPILTCSGCGATSSGLTGTPTDIAPAENCGDCPPWTCKTCGELSSAAALCSCWIQLDQLAPADIKALFAGDGTFNVGTDGRLTVAEPLEAAE